MQGRRSGPFRTRAASGQLRFQAMASISACNARMEVVAFRKGEILVKKGHKKSAPQGRAFQFVEIRLEVELVFEVYKLQIIHGFLAQ